VLLALLAAVLGGALNLAARASIAARAKVDGHVGHAPDAQAFLRRELESQHPLRMRKIASCRCCSPASARKLRYTRERRRRVAGGGILAVPAPLAGTTPARPLVLERVMPDLNAESSRS
jgi:hypothetical protein